MSEPNDDIIESETSSEETDAVVSPEEDELQKLIAERDQLKDQYLRAYADLDNFRKRSRREIEDAQRRAQEDVLREVLPLVDDLERAGAAAESATAVGPIVEGIRLVVGSFGNIAEKLDLERLTALGERFDPNVHDAVQQVETSDHEPGTVIAELVPGYRHRGKLLRPALVVVAKAAPKRDN